MIESAPSNALALGSAGEHIVCADLILHGYKAFLTNQMCAYDVAVDVGGRLIRIQVKSTLKSRVRHCGGRAKDHFFYAWNARAGKTREDRARRLLLQESDYLAFVALDIRSVAYVPADKQGARTIFQIKTSPLKEGDRTFANYPFVPR